MSKTINIGLIGFGMAGKTFHSPIIASVAGLKLKMIRETRDENIAAAKALYPDATVVDDVKAIFSDDNIDLVVVASSNTSHASLAKEALLAGKHVLVEKPFTVTTAEADELLDLAKQQNKILTVYQSRRWDSDFKTVKKVLGSGLLGRLVTYEAHYDRYRNEIRPNTWKEEALPGSGLLYDLGSHLIDQALLLFGLPKEITADIGTQRQNSKIVDNFDLRLHYEALKVTLKAGMLVREAGPHFILHGDQGSYIKYGMDVQEAALKAGLFPDDVADWGIEPQELWGNLNTTFQDLHVQGKIESEAGNYRGLYENVYKAILGEAELEVKPEQARNTIRVIELAMQSSAEKRTVAYS